MQRLIVFAILAIAVAYAADPSLDADWADWKETHSRTYEFGEEEVLRRAVWEDNLALINKHNSEYSLGKHTFTLQMNHLGDMTNKEINIMLNGFRGANTTQSRGSLLASLMKNLYADLPDKIDWRDKGYVTEVKDQKQCGSCWAFSATGSLEGQHFKKTGKLVSLSEQQLVDCSGSYGNHGCEGGLMDNAFRYIMANGGDDTEMCYPYTAKDGTCHFQMNCVGATDAGFVDIPMGDEQALKQAVATVGPISVAIDASKSTFHYYKSGVYMDKTCSSTRLDHGVLAVGYGNDMDGKYWLVKNSWGAMWGMQGYIMMARDSNNMCGIATQASYPTV